MAAAPQSSSTKVTISITSIIRMEVRKNSSRFTHSTGQEELCTEIELHNEDGQTFATMATNYEQFNFEVAT